MKKDEEKRFLDELIDFSRTTFPAHICIRAALYVSYARTAFVANRLRLKGQRNTSEIYHLRLLLGYTYTSYIVRAIPPRNGWFTTDRVIKLT